MTRLPHGSWPSPLDARGTLGATVRRFMPRADGADLYWLESRPEDAGRVTLVRSRDGEQVDVSPPGVNVRTRYLEYGGGDYGVDAGTVVWIDYATQRLWCGGGEREPVPITPDTGGAVRWARPRIDPARGVLYCLREDQRDPDLEAVNSLVRLRLEGPNDDLGHVLVAGRQRRRADRGTEREAAPGTAPDFVTDPELSPDGTRMAWLTWDHPSMPWQATTLWLGRLDAAGDLHDARAVAGGPHAGEALEQPLWRDQETLLVLSDRTGWSNLYTVDLASTGPGGDSLTPVTTGNLDLGQPRWVPDTRSYAVLPDGRLVSGRSRDGFRELVLIDPDSGGASPVPADLSFARHLTVLADGLVAVEAARATAPADILLVDPATGATRPATGGQAEALPPGLASAPEPLAWPTPDGVTAYGFLYRPQNPDAEAPVGDLPPLIVTLHGGPTSATAPGFNAARIYWTSRGFAVLDVNYGGSTGYGRAYRERLDGRWGIVDVQDATSGARHLADTGVVDGTRMAITGGSAGGFTTLAAATFTDVFAAGASHFGISDLATLATDTHKLESRYCDGLVAPWPDGHHVYAERSPIHHVNRLTTPLILLQGTDDRVVLPDQAELMARALREKGLPVALVLFEGEGHGFRALESQVRALEAELSFYAQIFGFEPADPIERIAVENLR